MARATQDITIWDESSDNSAEVTEENRLKVEGNKTSNEIYLGEPVHSLGDITQAATLISYTVPSGKDLFIYSWGFSSENANSVIELQINNTARDRMHSITTNQSDKGMRSLNNVRYTIPIKATAGQTVRLQRISGDTNRNRSGFIEGVLLNAI
jgi:hypothetical protein